jgi:YD repeat-containing protein
MGHWTFDYDSLGELVSQTDAKGQSMSYVYDALGRMETRNEPEGQTVWTWGMSSTARNIGRLEKVTSPGDPIVPGDQYKEEYTYDTLGRVQTAKYTQGGDVITALNDTPFADPQQAIALLRQLTTGAAMTATIERNGKLERVTLDGAAIQAEVRAGQRAFGDSSPLPLVP